MIEPLDFMGAWWDPLSQENIRGTYGRLTFSPERGALLELFGQFDLGTIFRKHAETLPQLIGVTTAGKHITLCNCSGRGATFVEHGLQVLQYDVETVLVGAHFESIENIAFERIDVQYSSLFEWAGIEGFNIELLREGNEIRGSRVEMVKPDTIPFHDGPDYRIGITSYHDSLPVGFGMDRRRSVAVTHNVYFQIDFTTPQLFHEKLDALYYLETLMSLAVGDRVRMNELEGFLTRGEKQIRVNIYYKQLGNALTADDIPAQRMLFTYPALAPQLGTMFGNWVAFGQDLYPMYDQFFSVRYAASMYIESEFLAMIQAFESLTRYLKNLSGNDFDMEHELQDVVQRHQAITSRTITDAAQFARDATMSRHYYSHRNLRQRRIAKSGLDLINITISLERLLELELLQMIGVQADALENIFALRWRS
ncbi:MAG: hypothetical protein JST22_13755 [Bacteroidetes bacterium]|nr:hypothetical protein [Bacteroidota bacterium]